MRKEPHIDQETLKRLLRYEPETGHFFWRHRDDVPNAWNARFAGKRAGTVFHAKPDQPYRQINISRVPHSEHHLAWLYVHGEWPPVGLLIDHENRNGLDNRIDNLRLATGSQNNMNSKLPANNTSGVKGVSWHKSRNKWRAYISRKHLGLFDLFDDAVKVRRRAEKKLFGEFLPT